MRQPPSAAVIASEGNGYEHPNDTGQDSRESPPVGALPAAAAQHTGHGRVSAYRADAPDCQPAERAGAVKHGAVDMASKYWTKLYHEILDDPKIGRFPVNLKWRFVELLLLAGELDEDGFLPPLPDMAWRLRVDEATLHQDMMQMQAAGIAEVRAYDLLDNRWYLSNFAKRQAPSPAAERMRELRKRKRKEAKEKENTDTERDTYRAVTAVTNRNGNVTGNSLSPIVEDIRNALVKVARLENTGAFSTAYQETAEVLERLGASAADVTGFGEWWARGDDGKPWLRNFVSSWDDFKAGRPSIVEKKKHGKASPPDVSILLSAMTRPYQEARQELEEAGAWPVVERIGRWEDIRKMTPKDIEFAWKRAVAT